MGGAASALSIRTRRRSLDQSQLSNRFANRPDARRAAIAAAREAGRKYISVASEILGEAAA